MHRALVLSALVLAGTILTPAAGSAACSATATRICLQDSRFGVEVAWTIPGGASGAGHALPQTDDTGLFWFFSDSNLELVVKVLDGRAINGHFWVYYGGLSDVEYTITVTDSQTGETETYHNPASHLASGADTSAFALQSPLSLRSLSSLSAAQAPAAAMPLRQGPELQANVTTQGNQQKAEVAIGADGGSMVVWVGPPSSPEADNETDVYGRFFDAQGNPRGGEVRLNENRAGAQRWPRVAAGREGGYMVVWQDGDLVMGRVYGTDGQPVTGGFRVSPLRDDRPVPAIAAVEGGYAVAWETARVDVDDAIAGRLFDARGNPVTPAFGIAEGSDAGFGGIRLTGLPGGGFVVAWLRSLNLLADGGIDGGVSLAAQRFDASLRSFRTPIGPTGAPLLLGAHRAAAPIVHPDGSFSLVWTTVSQPPSNLPLEGLFAQRFSAQGDPLTTILQLRQGHFPQAPAATLLPSGDTLVLWHEAGQALDADGGVLAQIFNSSWSPLGSEFRINSFTLLPQTEPAVASDASGHLMAVWSSGLDLSQGLPPFPGFVDESQDGSGFGVFGQRFATATCALTSDQLCLNGRFRVDVHFTSPFSGEPESAHAVPLTSDTGAFWFFGQDNLELMIKVLDGRTVNGHFWVYAGALSDVAYTITLTDTETGKVKTYRNEQGHLASRADVEAF